MLVCRAMITSSIISHQGLTDAWDQQVSRNKVPANGTYADFKCFQKKLPSHLVGRQNK